MYDTAVVVVAATLNVADVAVLTENIALYCCYNNNCNGSHNSNALQYLTQKQKLHQYLLLQQQHIQHKLQLQQELYR